MVVVLGIQTRVRRMVGTEKLLSYGGRPLIAIWLHQPEKNTYF